MRFRNALLECLARLGCDGGCGAAAGGEPGPGRGAGPGEAGQRAGPAAATALPAPPSQSRQDSVSHCRLRPGWGDIRPFLQCGNTQVHSPLLQVSLSFLTRLQWTGTCCYRTEILTRQTDVGGGDSFTPFATPLAIPFCYRVPGPQYKQPVKPGLRWSDSNRKRTILVIKKRLEMP